MGHGRGAGFEYPERALEFLAFFFDGPIQRVPHVNRRANRDRYATPWFRHLRSIPALHRPEPIGLDVKGKDGMPGRAGEKDRAGLRHARGTARPVNRERGGPAQRKVLPQLHERARSAARRGPARRPVPEALDDPGNPLAVEVLAGDDDDAAVLPEERGGQDTAVPEGEDRLLAGGDDRVIVFEPLDAPAICGSERADYRGTSAEMAAAFRRWRDVRAVVGSWLMAQGSCRLEVISQPQP